MSLTSTPAAPAMREQFEAWATSQDPYPEELRLKRPDGEYQNFGMRMGWYAWQASLLSAAPVAPTAPTVPEGDNK